MKKLVLSTIAALGLTSAAFVVPAPANAMGTGSHSGAANVFVGCSVSTSSSSSTPTLVFAFLQASAGITNLPSTFTSCAAAVAAVEALGLHVVAEETVVPVGATTAAATAAPLLIIHLDNTNTGGNTGGNIGSHTGHNTGGNIGSNTGGNTGMQ